MSKHITCIGIACAIGNVWPGATWAQSSKDFAAMGRLAWSAFECSALASKAKNANETERLFRFGYEQGKRFFEALAANKIESKDISSTVPIGITMAAQGPSIDFILGRVYTGAVEEALKDVYETDGKFNPDELQVLIARNSFGRRNCELIGVGGK